MAFVVATVLLCSSPAWADYDAGQTAWKAGRHAEALTQWQAAARSGDARAMLALGRAYVKGLSVPQDYVEAHKWLNLAAGRGNAEAADERGVLAAKMTPQQVASAQERARAWRSGGTANAPKTADVPRAAAPSPAAGPPPAHAIREAQGLMAALGYKPGSADGHWGPRTARAYAAFLRDAGLPPGNVLTPDALGAMRAAARGRNVVAAATPKRGVPATQRKATRPPADLHRLVAAGDVDGLKAALARGADASVRDGKGWTPLMHAADKGRTLLVPPLLKAGADPNVRAADGATALFIAAVHGHSEIIMHLMTARADPSIKGPQGRTASDLARSAYGGLEAARRKGSSPEVLALVGMSKPTSVEVQQDIENEKEMIKKTFIDCGYFLMQRSKYSNSERYRGSWRRFSKATFLGDDLTIESEHYIEKGYRDKFGKLSYSELGSAPGPEKTIWTIDVLALKSTTILARHALNFETGLYSYSFYLQGKIRTQKMSWSTGSPSRQKFIDLTLADETAGIMEVCDKQSADTIVNKLMKLKKTLERVRR